MPRYNWRRPSRPPVDQSPAPVDDVDDDQDDQQLPEAEPNDSLPTVERVVFRPNGAVVHLKWPTDNVMFCGRFPMNGTYRANAETGPVCKRCRTYAVVIPAPDDPASYEAADDHERVRFLGHGGDLAKVVHLRWTGAPDGSPYVFCGLHGQAPASPTSLDDGPLCQHCVWDMDEIKERERWLASIRKTSLGSGRR